MIFRPYFWHSLGAFCIAEKRGEEMRGGRGESRPIRHALLHFGVLQSASDKASERASEGEAVGSSAPPPQKQSRRHRRISMSATKRIVLKRLSGPNGDRPVAVDPDKGMGGNNKRANEHARPETNYPVSTTPVHVRSPIGLGLNAMVGTAASALWSGERQDHSTYAGVSERLYSSYGECGCQMCSLSKSDRAGYRDLMRRIV